jgi:hypothetical protein
MKAPVMVFIVLGRNSIEEQPAIEATSSQVASLEARESRDDAAKALSSTVRAAFSLPSCVATAVRAFCLLPRAYSNIKGASPRLAGSPGAGATEETELGWLTEWMAKPSLNGTEMEEGLCEIRMGVR